MIRIALDAMGGDFAPHVPVAGAVEALQQLPESCEIQLVGRKAEVEAALASHDAPPDRLRVVDAPEVIEMGDKPLAAIRSKRKSSIRVGLELQKAGEADAFISAGNTGAIMAGSTLLLGLHAGVERPAIGAVLPSRQRRLHAARAPGLRPHRGGVRPRRAGPREPIGRVAQHR